MIIDKDILKWVKSQSHLNEEIFTKLSEIGDLLKDHSMMDEVVIIELKELEVITKKLKVTMELSQ